MGGISSATSARGEARQRGHVGVLEGRGEPVEQRAPARLRGLGDVVLGGQRLRELQARARRSVLLTAVVAGPKARSPTCAAGRSSTSRKISTARCRADRYCNAATRASRIPARDTATAAGSSCSAASSRVRQRLQPRHLRRCHQWCRRVLVRTAQAGRQGPAATAFDGSQARVGRDPIQPGAHRRTALEPVKRAPCPQIRLLNQVLGLLGRAEHPVAVSQQLTRNCPVRLVKSSLNRHLCPSRHPLRQRRRPYTYRPGEQPKITAEPQACSPAVT